MLNGRRVLIVEDETLIAMELGDLVVDAGGQVVGPARSNRQALALLDRDAVDVALLDLNLADGDATPTAQRLIDEGIPVLICTAGVLPRAMRAAWPHLPVHSKPVAGGRLIQTLADLSAGSLTGAAEPPPQAASGAAPTSWRA
ncbi:response regulator [uncultured Methylobacterium sp.]|jgi:DNA-binding NarL/FixJ family response regulator|uniref:response regulator n=1 Tax=uncultured Methylobacterium sp. TaxID=157278 RepID=UPI0026204A7D|nr:response regulator [uncultured Methylobacterium sp.]